MRLPTAQRAAQTRGDLRGGAGAVDGGEPCGVRPFMRYVAERTNAAGIGLAELATRQHGVVSTASALALGFAKSARHQEGRERGRLHRLHQRRLCGGASAADLALRGAGLRCLAAEPMSGRVVWPAVASHLSAAYFWGLLRFRPETIHVTAPMRRRAKRELRVHFSSILAQEDRASGRGFRSPRLPRSLLDLAIRARPDQLERLLERAEEARTLRPARGRRRARPRRWTSRPWSPRRALALYQPDPSFTRSRLREALPPPRHRRRASDPLDELQRRGLELDAYWPDLRFAVELDLFETHGTRAAFERDHRRQEELKLLGIEMIRVTRPRFQREPQAVIRNLATFLERRRAELRRRLN